MIQYWKYSAVTRTGHMIHGVCQGNKGQLKTKFDQSHTHVVRMEIDFTSFVRQFIPRKALSTSCLLQFFNDFHNMHATGMDIAQILQSLKETAQDRSMRDVITVLEQRVQQGDSLTEAILFSTSFPWIVVTSLQAGEKSGRLKQALETLSKYFQRSGDVKGKLAQALIYPSIVFMVLIVVMLFVGLRVVPKLQNLLPPEAISHGATHGVLILSALLQRSWLAFIVIPLLMVGFIVFVRKYKKDMFEQWLYQWPVVGNLIKESALSYYFLNLSILLKNGVPLLSAMSDLNVINASQVSQHFNKCRDYMFGGMTFWEAVKTDSFFPLTVIFTIRRGEEMARLDDYCFNLSEYFNKRVNSRLEALINLIQPMLLAVGGLFLVFIAVAFLVPIYGSLTQIAGG